MADVRIKLNIDSTGAVQSVNQVQGALQNTNVELKGTSQIGVQLNRVLEYAFGAILQRMLTNITSKLREMSSGMLELATNIQDVSSQFSAVFRNVREEADAFVERFREMTGFTTTESRKIAAEIAEIALSLGESDEAALELAESSARLALQWERIAGMDFANGQRMITRALVGQVMELQRAGIVSREWTMTQFQALTMQQRLAIVTQGLTARYGDLDSATDGLTQKQRQMQGRIKDIQEAIATQLIPILSDVIEDVSEWFDKNEELLENLSKLAGFLAFEMAGVLKGFLAALSEIVERMERAESASERMWVAIRELAQRLNVVSIAYNVFVKELDDANDGLYDFIRSTDEAAGGADKLGNGVGKITVRFANFAEAIEISNKVLKEFIDGLGGIDDLVGDRLFEGVGDSIEDALTPDEVSVERFVNIFRDAAETGVFSIDGINAALRELQVEMTATADPGQRAQLIEYINDLERLRDKALGASEGMAQMVDLSHTAQTAIVELASSFGELLSSLDRVGDFGARIRGLMASLIVDFGRMLVSLGTMSLAISQWNPLGMIAAGTAAIAVGSAMKARTQSAIGGGGTASQGTTPTTVNSGGLRGLPTGGVTQNTTASFKQALSEIKWKVTTDVKLGKLMIEMENEQRKISGTL
jgi:hypothetical protein